MRENTQREHHMGTRLQDVIDTKTHRIFPSATIRTTPEGEGYLLEDNIIYPSFYFQFKPI